MSNLLEAYSYVDFTSLSWPEGIKRLAVISLLVLVLYNLFLGVYRVYLSPLAKIPGPKLAGQSHLESAYR